MNYGQLHRWKRFEQVTYEYAIPFSVFIDHVSPWFDQHRKELQADLLYGAPLRGDPEYGIAKLGYPNLYQMLTEHFESAKQILLASPLELNNLLAPIGQSNIRYAVNSVDIFSSTGSEIRLGGIAFDLASND